ncbi:MAG TPA: aspartyl/asparaginyl beta-hydroxylase domain-containing protein [Bryobacteraceae bacterium]|nr:aspartyl/asparaginyl beta-hydroxylase domain-containing protein [Bryobacteraceae bacterium]HUO31635.1 aspartyl/asparaginyl beta-hydroxylase domain-containing protein [Bryobacteraceae bacterium]
MFFDPSAFPFTKELEESWLEVRRELENLPEGAWAAWPERALYGSGWNTFGFYFFGRKFEQNCVCCPQSARLVERIPGMVTAGFSYMAPGTHIRPHRGYSSTVLRCHLGLVVPPNCGIRVGSETREWAEGKCMIFDDTQEHEAWNRSGKPRAILLLDFSK